VWDQDLELAKSKLIEENLSLVIIKNGKIIFKTQKQGLTGFLEAIEKLGKNLVTASMADKIVGVAASMLCAYAKVASVFALTISKEGSKVLEGNNIVYRFKEVVPNILNRNKKDVCPFEKLAMRSSNPEEAYVKLRSCAIQMMRKNSR